MHHLENGRFFTIKLDETLDVFSASSPAMQDCMTWRSSVSKILTIWRRRYLTIRLNMVTLFGLSSTIQLITHILVAQIEELYARQIGRAHV